MGLMLFPGDSDTTSPDVAWSYGDFAMFRRWLARTEGFELDEMDGFGGERPWSDVSTALEPLLDHPDDAGPDFPPSQCAAMLPRLQQIAAQTHDGAGGPDVARHLDDVRRLVVVLRLCTEKGVECVFG
ncbi:hypothetical protein HTV80_12200 [Streptomyces sp. Vc74B-19]|uniref:hypothetical protein n=1 Tax=Streptomyces sp. Vc74B-19 TaxID=2741324 RepID=UPI001BFC9C70|nr:hypothetical protein [Streptomyces sp. Vc74B-19]MBT3163870.1 hypothetical protein [Streptomyces sp. Vc74B-19]